MPPKPSYEELERRVRELEKSEKALKQSAERYRTIVFNSPLGIFRSTFEGRLIEVNPALARILGYDSPEEVIQSIHDISEQIYLQSGKREQIVSDQLQLKDISKHRNRYRRKDGSEFTANLYLKTVCDSNEKPVFLEGIVEDVTRLRQTEEALRESEEKFRLIFENSADGHILYAEDRFVDCNPACLELLGFNEKKQLLSRHPRDISPPYQIDGTPSNEKSEHMIALAFEKGSHRFVWLCQRLDGSDLMLDVLLNVIRIQGKNIIHGVWRDITEKIRSEEQLRKNEERLSLALETARLGYWRWSPDSNQVEWFGEHAALFGIDDSEFRGILDHVQEMVHPDDREMGISNLQKAVANNLPFDNTYRVIHPDDTVHWLNSFGHISLNDRGAPSHIYGITRDITEFKLVEEKQRMMVEMLDTAPSSIIVHDYDGRFLYANRKTFDIHGYDEDEFMSLNLKDVDVPESRALIEKRLQEVNEKGETSFQVSHFRKDGTTVPLEVYLKMVTWSGRPAVLSIATDITDRNKSEMERDRLIRAIEHAGEVFVITDTDGSIQYVNPAFEKVTGYSYEEVLGKNPRILKSGQHDENFYAELWNTISNGKKWSGRLVNRSKAGELYTEEATISPVKDANETIASYVAVKRDITQELAIAKQLQQAQKMESIGNLAGGIAHDFNNILFPIVGMAELLMEDFAPGSQERENAQVIFEAGKRGGDLVKQILAFSRQSEHKLIPVRIQQILKEVFKLSRSTIPTYIEIEQDIQSDCGLVLADATQIHQVAMNIITNAYHAVESSGGKITLKLHESFLSSDELQDLSLSSGRYAIISIADTGHGMSPEVRDKIFEPYFTTKENGKGTGLGLAVAYGIVKEHKGAIRLTSQVGKGSTFDIYLPLMGRHFDVKSSNDMEPCKTGTERILLVDDEAPIVNIEKQMLERLGYKVTSRLNSIEALEAFRANPDAFDLVVSDMAMPHMTGDKLAMELKRMKPGLPVIICTGFSERINKEQAESIGINGFLMKPVIKSEIAGMIRKVLDAPNGVDPE